jgi:hypothetical protein
MKHIVNFMFIRLMINLPFIRFAEIYLVSNIKMNTSFHG